MDVEKNETHFNALPWPEYVPESTTATIMPPPYTDEPPAYSTVIQNPITTYSSIQEIPDYMSKLPFGEPSDNSSYYPLPPPAVQSYSQQPVNPQVTTEHPPNPPRVSQLKSNPTAPYKVLLQPTSSRIVETKTIGHRKTKSHVTDLETGKEYFVKEKTSRNGKRSKAVIKEVGGPKTFVKETPKKTVVCQKKF